MLQTENVLPRFTPSQDLSLPLNGLQPKKPCTASHTQPLLSESLLRGHKIVEIAHNGSLYKLQATKLGKLILTK
jgi:hemin uptake protein HemP